jgi:hypothetical protein
MHDVGKFLFGFTVFWAYISFCEYFLYWYANIPEETICTGTAGRRLGTISMLVFPTPSRRSDPAFAHGEAQPRCSASAQSSSWCTGSTFTGW